MSYVRPVTPTGLCTWSTHRHRVPPSQEAGVDYYCPIGTPVHAAADGRVFEVAGNVTVATGRFVTIDLDDGRRVRYLHLSKQLVKPGQTVKRGDVVGHSGASGYGSEFFGARDLAHIPANTGGPHVHTTLWPRHAYDFGPDADTLDFDKEVDHATTAGGGAVPFPTEEVKVTHYNRMDATALSKTGRILKPGASAYLHTELGAPASNASNVIGGRGIYDILAHFYAQGQPGDVFSLVAIVQTDPTTTPATSDSYTERFVLDSHGLARGHANWMFDFAAATKPTAVYIRVVTDATNKGDVKVVKLNSDALLFTNA